MQPAAINIEKQQFLIHSSYFSFLLLNEASLSLLLYLYIVFIYIKTIYKQIYIYIYYTLIYLGNCMKFIFITINQKFMKINNLLCHNNFRIEIFTKKYNIKDYK